ncbi:AAA family ATPase [Candidatus Pacearchaeota archaeon]|nr:AAA family ATPase [Candidatus Pacearchaeota archaeon]
MIIGLTGTKASGKGVIAGMLKERGFVYYSLSDIVREEAKRQGIFDYTITQLQDIGNELREKYGNGILAERILEKIEEGKNYAIDGIRNPGEVEELRTSELPEWNSDSAQEPNKTRQVVLDKCKGHKFILIAVDASPEIRFKRLIERKRESDPKDWQGFLEMDRRDRGTAEENSGQQVEKCIELADIKIYNGSSIGVLKNKIEKMLKDLKC